MGTTETTETTPTADGFEAAELIWLDGEIIEWADARIHVLTHALHYGTGVFEGVRCYETDDGPAIFRWDDHLDRLYQSGRPFGIELPYSHAELTDATTTLIDRQGFDACYIRPIAFYGADRLGINPDGLSVRTAIAAWPAGTYLGADAIETGVDVTVSSWRRIGGTQLPTTSKTTGGYANSVLASIEATAEGYDEAIMLNEAGTVAEGPGENLFVVRDGELLTPAVAEGVLPGITRDTVVTLAEELGYPVREDATISRGELYTADELFFCGTAAEVTPIRQVDTVTVGDGSPGPITEAIQSRFYDVVSGDVEAYAEWLTPVESRAPQHTQSA